MPEYDVNYRENVVATLKHESPSYLPRGEIFFTRTFLNVIFPEFIDDYIEQLASAASLLGLSVVGVDLNDEWSRSLLSQGKYSRLKKYFTVGYINGPVLRSIERLGFKQAMLGIKKDRGTVFRITSDILDDIQDVCSLAKKNEMSGILLPDDIAGNNGLYFSFEDFGTAILPLYKQIASEIKGNDLFAFFHSDGDTHLIIEPLIKAGFDCIHPVDSQAGLDLYELKYIHKNMISFMGHIDIMTWDDERINQEINKAEKSFNEGGLIIGSTCGLSMKTVSKKLGALYPRLHKWSRGV
ncbi:MAG TPA: uroporphyrinogen decarboxylase family protein [Syntrophorhabdus sp.]|nr:uroporphyrinogen decarboxylase family protein [Syntrophorhabdus sp.]